ncbi:MAG: hypothetical protein DME65_12510 [Verrucomicrobia bacterium]|nr:MAG: hypothetical protein DME65_12510 [Verrucomicrobiota bacterium]
MTAVDNLLDLIAGDPIIIRRNQRAGAIVQFQCWIGHCIWNSELSKLRPNRAQNYALSLIPLHDESTNHHVIAGLNKAASADIAQIRSRAVEFNPVKIGGPATNDRIVELKRVTAGVQSDGRLY